MPRSREEAQEAQRQCKMAMAVNKAMSLDAAVVLSDASGNLLGEGRIVRKERSDAYGLVVFFEGRNSPPVPLPFIKKMALKGA